MTTCTTTQEQPTEVIVAANDQALPGNLDSILVSYANRIQIIQATRVPLQQVMDQIRSSDDLREKISRIRSLMTIEQRQVAKK